MPFTKNKEKNQNDPSDCRQKPDLRNKVSGFFYEEKCCKTLKFQRIKPVI